MAFWVIEYVIYNHSIVESVGEEYEYGMRRTMAIQMFGDSS